MNKHTPGPWIVGSYDFLDQQVYIDAPSGDPDLGYKSWEGVAIAYGCEESPSKGLEKAKANAMLIAAAPDLLEALEFVADIDIAGADDRVIRFILVTAQHKVAAAIAKAKGDQA